MKKFFFLLAAMYSIGIIAQDTYLHCGKIIDAKSGQVITAKTIVVSGSKINSIQDGFVNPKSSKDVIVDLKDKTVMPGFIDMHVHIEGETSPTQYLAAFTKNDTDVAYDAAEIANRTLLAGFTTVRDLGGSGVNVALRDAINKGKVPFSSSTVS